MNLRKYLKENVWGLIWSIITAVCMCLIFLAWGEKVVEKLSSLLWHI